MKRLDIIVEGPSEREFISQSLAPYLEREGVILSYDVSPIVIHTKPNFRGGMTKYSQLKADILQSLSSSNSDMVVSMMIDFFRLPANVPRPDNYSELASDSEKIYAIERSSMTTGLFLIFNCMSSNLFFSLIRQGLNIVTARKINVANFSMI